LLIPHYETKSQAISYDITGYFSANIWNYTDAITAALNTRLDSTLTSGRFTLNTSRSANCFRDILDDYLMTHRGYPPDNRRMIRQSFRENDETVKPNAKIFTSLSKAASHG